MIACPCKRNVRLHQASKGLSQSSVGRIQNREMIEAGCALWWWRPVTALPSVESDMMMITARGNKGRFVAVSLCQLKSENAAVKIECPLQISHLQMHMPDAHPADQLMPRPYIYLNQFQFRNLPEPQSRYMASPPRWVANHSS